MKLIILLFFIELKKIHQDFFVTNNLENIII